ncbi:MAG: tetratricopeptide repeat protein [Balneolales bacterium]
MLVSGCASTLQNGWSDFNAYFNTYYNAKTSFERGVDQIENQAADINPERPVRIHQEPVQAGRQEFNEAIEKSADILRFHPTSRYTDNAIEIIGQSYFYQEQYFSASQKFLELYNTTQNDLRRQNAILWRGRSMLELESYDEGLSYLKAQLFSSDYDWDRVIEAEIKLVIAQLHVYNREWEDAELYLAEGKEEISDRELLARAHFLHGQVLEKLERYDEAFASYDLAVHRKNTEYDVTYHAMLKKAQVSRELQDYQYAYDFLVSMTRDDKYFEFMDELLYEVARTLQKSGDYRGAQGEYDHLLNQTMSTPTRETMAKTFYGLAEIHRDYFNDYRTASAYFDSSAQQATDLNRLPEDFNASLLSSTYGSYTDLVNREQRLDSLLWLGSLPEAKFDSVITTIREQKILEMEQQEQQQQRAGDRLVSVDDVQVTDAAEDTENGFLNHMNPQIMAQVSQTFRAYWGPRPLVDNWRRAEAVRFAALNRSRNNNSGDSEIEDLSDDEIMEEMLAEQGGETGNEVHVDISEVPFTEEARAESRERIAETHYEIGNVFFLTLNMPDSARTRYERVLDQYPNSRIAPQAMYSLSETYRSEGDTLRARDIAITLVDQHPQSKYARQIAESHSIALDYEPEDTEMTRQDSLNQEYNKILDELDESNRRENAGKLKSFAYAYKDSDKAPRALYRAATEYLELARLDSLYHEKLAEQDQAEQIRHKHELRFTSLQDSSQVMLQDTTQLSEEEYSYWASIADSTHTPPEISNSFPYEGAHWDSARTLLTEISQNYPGFTSINRVKILNEEIGKEEEEEDINVDVEDEVEGPH